MIDPFFCLDRLKVPGPPCGQIDLGSAAVRSDSSTATRAGFLTHPSLDFLIGNVGIIVLTSRGGFEAEKCTCTAPSVAPGTLQVSYLLDLSIVKIFKKVASVTHLRHCPENRNRDGIRERGLPSSRVHGEFSFP